MLWLFFFFFFIPQAGLRGISGLDSSGAGMTHKGSLAQPNLGRKARPAPWPAAVSSPPTGNHRPRAQWLRAPRWTGTSSVSCGSCNPEWWCRRSWGTWGRRWWCWESGQACGAAQSAPRPCSCATCNWGCRWWSGCRRSPPGPGAGGRRRWSVALSHTWRRTCTWAGDIRQREAAPLSWGRRDPYRDLETLGRSHTEFITCSLCAPVLALYFQDLI